MESEVSAPAKKTYRRRNKPESARSRPELPSIQYATIPEVAEALCITETLALRWIRIGKMRAAKFGSKYRIPISEVKRLISEFEGTA